MSRRRGPVPADELDPLDEFDVDGFPSHRTGAHRARPGVLSRWGPTVLTLAAALAVLVVLVGALVLLGPRGLASLVVRLWDVAGSAVGLAAGP